METSNGGLEKEKVLVKGYIDADILSARAPKSVGKNRRTGRSSWIMRE